MTDGFADLYLDEDYKTLSRKLIDKMSRKLLDKMSRKRQVPFLYGRLEIWAAAVVYALGQTNFLFDKSFEPYVSATDLCNYLGTSQSTTSQKAKIIRDMFKMRYFDEEFSTERMLKENPFNEFVTIDGLIVPFLPLWRCWRKRELNYKKNSDWKMRTLKPKKMSPATHFQNLVNCTQLFLIPEFLEWTAI
jgi:hypothetical protein